MKRLLAAYHYCLLLCLVSIAGASASKAQLVYGAKSNLNLGWLPFSAAAGAVGSTAPSPEREMLDWNLQPGFGLELGGWANFYFQKRCFVETGITYSHTSGRFRYRGPVVDQSGQSTGANQVLHLAQNLDGLSMPLIVGLNTTWASISVGMQANANLSNTLRYSSRFEGEPINLDAKGVLEGLKPWNLGLLCGLTTSINNRFSIEARYFHGLTDIYEGTGFEGVMKLRQITYGVRYRIGGVRF